MNQISIFCFIIWGVITTVGGADAIAQRPDFRLTENQQPSLGQLLPAQHLPIAPNHQTNYPNSFPQQPVSFDSQVNSASFAAPVESNSKPTTDSYGLLGESAGPALLGLKDAVVSKVQGLLSSTEKSSRAASPNIPKMVSSLAIVLGGYFAFVWIARKLSPSSNSRLPAEVVDVLGRTSFGPRQSLQLVRLGNKLVLLLNGPEGTHPIGDISDPDEVEHLTSLCGGRKTGFSRRGTTPPVSRNRMLVGAAQSSNPVAQPSLLSNEQVAQSLASVLKTLENTAGQHNRTTFEA